MEKPKRKDVRYSMRIRSRRGNQLTRPTVSNFQIWDPTVWPRNPGNNWLQSLVTPICFTVTNRSPLSTEDIVL
ncbi:hypothetical protein VNO77_00447 [Canavalia gladiata]|uniref:Uncharacterized protein n=1 Tax=Canavalia gladiata TaxID=3824 RepID=A0AAN9MQ18_CANGL